MKVKRGRRPVALFIAALIMLTTVFSNNAAVKAAGRQVTFVDDGAVAGTANTDASNHVTGIAAPQKNGMLFAGWYTQNVGVISNVSAAAAYAFDFSTAVSSDMTLYAGWIDVGTGENSSFYLKGVQYRVVNGDTSAGIRFITKLGDELVNKVSALNSQNAQLKPQNASRKGIGYGTVLTYAENLSTGAMLTKDETATSMRRGFVVLPAVNTYTKGPDYITYTAFVVNIPQASYSQHIAARPYITYADANGTVQTYYYTENSGTTHKAGGAYYLSYNEAVNNAVANDAINVVVPTQEQTEAPTQEQTEAPLLGYDLVITNITWTPANPTEGDHVVFTATIKNNGDTPTPQGTIIGYQVQIDANGTDVLWCDTYDSSLMPGQSVNLTCNYGLAAVEYWTAVRGSHSVTAWVDDIDRLPAETDENNNHYTKTINVAEPQTQPETQPEVVENPETNVPKNINLMPYYVDLDRASCSTTGSGNETADKMFDQNGATKFYTGDGFPIRVAWKMSRAVVVKNYSITTGADSATYSYRNPYKWQLYGSNDGTSWIQLDYVDGGGIGAVNNGVYSYDTDVQEAYQYFQLQVESNGTYYYGLQIADITLYGDVADISNNIGDNLVSYYDSIYQSANTAAGFNNEVAGNLFDKNVNTKLFNIGTGVISWKMDRETTVYSYTLTTANDNATYTGRLPKSWILYGSKNGSTWEQIDAVANAGMADVNFTPYTYTVDKVGAYTYYKLDIKSLVGNTFQLSEIGLNGAAISPSRYDILLKGDWNLITTPGYVDELIKLFYNSYPRLYARWGTGTEPTTITFMADRNYDGVAYCQGTTVCVSTTYANANPTDIGFFSHEITHSVQQYGNKLVYGDNDGWFTENMANYGGFRYFHWSNPKYVQIYTANDTSLQDWGYEKYGNNKWFFAYMDSRYPTRKDANGNITYGLLDSLNLMIKANNSGTPYAEDPYDTTNEFNQCVYRVTGYACIDDLRKRFVQELQQGTWNFTGFANYEDNWLTENIEGIANPQYPMLGDKIHGNTTNAKLSSAVTTGTNLMSGASVYATSGYINENEAASKFIDGNLTTKWCATASNVTDKTYALNQVQHWIAVDLGSVKTFNTYTLYNTQSREGYANATEWELLISNDGTNWTSVDYQNGQNDAVSSFGIGSKSARYVMMKVFTSDNGPGTVRLYELQLYNR
ncbi:MAG: discoidin domain-containing protein [Lachnospiraceae bacterium]|nr:discoidin domain-containing protein [Lachnospiraceae bacterium]